MIHTPARHTGFTLVEMLMAISILVILISGVVTLTVYFFRNYNFSFEETQSVSTAQYGMTEMIREIREARMAEDGSWPVIDASDMSFSFYSDVTNDGKSDKVRYYLSGNTLLRGVIQPSGSPVAYPAANEKTTVVAANLDTNGKPLFTYYNGNWPGDTANNPLAAANRIMNTRFVKIFLRIKVRQNGITQPFELTSGVSVRSLKDNL